MTDGGDSPGVPADGGPAPSWATVQHDDQRREALPDLYTVSVVQVARARLIKITGPDGSYVRERPSVLIDARFEDRAAAAAVLRAAADELAPAPATAAAPDGPPGPGMVTTGDEAAEFLNLTRRSCRSCPEIPHVWIQRPSPTARYSHPGTVRYCPGDGAVVEAAPDDPHTDGGGVPT